jgi:Flp pilus assembly protein protease CpaA
LRLLLFLLDLPLQSERISRDPWVPLVLVLLVVFILAVGFAGGLVVFLIWFKRRKLKQAAADAIPATQTNPTR